MGQRPLRFLAAMSAAATAAGMIAVTAPAHAAQQSQVAQQSHAARQSQVGRQAQEPADGPASLVNPFIGTSDGGNTFPGADAPFGMVQWSPDTTSRPPGGGYYYGDSAITGFSLTHLSGPGCDAAGDVPILPTTGPAGPAAAEPFSHSSESADAGYYAVTLGNGVTAELTATTRTGMAAFTFPATTEANLIFKLSGSQNGDSATSFTAVSDTEVAGSVTSTNFCGARTPYTLHFDMVFDHPFRTEGTYSGSSVRAGARRMTTHATGRATAPATVPPSAPEPSGHPAYHGPLPPGHAYAPALTGPTGAYVTFDTTGSQVILAKVGVSYVSAAGAAANLAAENPGWDFDATRQATQDAWNRLLGRIQVTGGSTSQQQVFYTALYHALLHPNVYSDAGGEYMGADGKVHTVDPGHKAFYTNFSGWDIYRSQAQLEALLDPSAASDTAQSMVDVYAQTGMLPKWVENDGETYIMAGDPADPILAGYYAFGARGFDTKAALADMLAEATRPGNIRPGLHYLNDPGYLPVDGSYGCCNFYGPVSTTLEYGTADFAISAFASALGDTQDAAAMASRAQDWQNLFNPASGYIQPKYASGQFVPGFDPTSEYSMVEGDPAQYTLMVPFNVAGLAGAMGGDAAFTGYLDHFFTEVDGSRTSPYAAMSNEPSIGTPWEYDYAGEPYKTQQLVRRIQQQLYTDTPGGIAGNDDLGTMSAWYVWSALGMYPETPGTAYLALGSPEFPAASIRLASGKAITISAPQAAPDAPYVQNLRLDGRGWPRSYLPPSVLTDGAALDYTLGTAPDTTWGSGAHAAPPSYQAGAEPAIPYTQPSATVSLSPGGSAQATVGAQNETHAPQAITWTASSSSADVTVSPAHGTFRLAPDQAGGQQVTLTAAPGAQPPATITVHLISSTGAALTTVLLTWAAPGEFPPYGCPQTAQFAHVIPQSQMTATATSHQPGYEPANAIDGNCATFWHTEYSPVHAYPPQSITLNLGGSYDVSGLTYIPRQDGNKNGNITGYNVYVSTDGQTFTEVASGTWSSAPSAKSAAWTPVPARYLRLEATSGYNGFVNADEINVAYAGP
jgi:putative alpha-1,2-mannosidase